jgi:ribonuclease BN (tRNA processing enzyme)
MKIKILGTRGEVEPKSPYHSRHSGVLIDNKILLDLGEKEFLKYKPAAVFITHLHPDHAYFIKELLETNIPIYAPEKSKNCKTIKIPTKAKRTPFKAYKITPIPTHHSKKVKSTAYLVEKGKKRILYTGDMIWIDKKYHFLLCNLNLVITEASCLRKGGLVRKDKKTSLLYGHTGIPDLVNLFKKFSQDIVFVHFGGWFYKDIRKSRTKLAKLGKENNVSVKLGYDGMEFCLNSF